MASPAAPKLSSSTCQVLFGRPAPGTHAAGSPPALCVDLTALAGDDCEALLSGGEIVADNGVALFVRDGLVAGFTAAAPGDDLEAATGDVYRRIFAAAEGRHLYRLWNYVPHINAVHGGLENYRRFCRARSLAFESRFGPGFESLLPSSSAVGALAGPLAVAFVAGSAPGRHFENPAQVPAFHYPAEHGPRPPSFSRATVAETDRVLHVFISGTAAIRGHATVAPGELDRQLECTLENLHLIGTAAGTGPALGADGPWRRRFKVYLRHPGDLGRVVARLETELLRPADRVAYLHADICRAELVVEIEAALERARAD